MDIERRKKIIALKMNEILAKRNQKIDAINERQKKLNAERAAVYAQYQAHLDELQEELATLNGRSSEFSHPQKNFEQNA